jgi:hypothetical protein
MEAFGEFSPDQAVRLGLSDARMATPRLGWSLPAAPTASHFGADSSSDGGGSADLDRSLQLLKSLRSTAAGDAALFGLREAADFADHVEELSRTVEYLQVVAAGAVDRARREAASSAGTGGAAAGWTTGWVTEPAVHGPLGWNIEPGATDNREADEGVSPVPATGSTPRLASAIPSPASAIPSPADDGYRTTAEYLRARLRISVAEGRRRLALASAVLPRTGITGHPQPPELPELAAALAAGTIASRPATIIALALDRVRHHASPDATLRMEHALTCTAAENDPDFLARIARHWTDAIDQDGSEPADHELRQRQGAFLRPVRRGLHHLEIFATTDQYEHLLTVMNTATNPRARGATPVGDATVYSDATAGSDACNGPDAGVPGGPAAGVPAAEGGSGAAGEGPAVEGAEAADGRTRPQLLLDGLVGACKAALSTMGLPATGGLRPQVMVTIDYRDLLDRLERRALHGPRRRFGIPTIDAASLTGWDAGANTDIGSARETGFGQDTGAGQDAGSARDTRAGWDTGADPVTRCAPGAGPDPDTSGRPAPGTGTFTFAGPVTPATVRRIACDADIIPVLLGSEGRILDIGRASRIFPPHIRKAITARDLGCAFPQCTFPASWCEAHHITYWSRGGTTSTENGALLCPHHHHLIHKEQWSIQVRGGVPWFIPPAHVDPRQVPRRNHYFRLE